MVKCRVSAIRQVFRVPAPVGLTSAMLASVLTVSGCAVGPNYQAPKLPAGADAPLVSKTVEADGEHEPPAQWWHLYRDETLNTLVKKALAANTDLRVAEANLERARAVFDATDSRRYPDTGIDTGARYGREQSAWSGPGKAPKQWTYSGGLVVNYEVDLFGRVRRDIEAASADAQAMAAARDTVRLAVVAETTRAYIDSCSLGKSIDVAENSVQLADRGLQLIRQRESAGVATRLDVARAATSLAQARAILSPLQGERRSRLLELAALVGETPSAIPDGASQCRQVPQFSSALPVGDGLHLLRRRPDVRMAERQLAANTARIGVAVSSLYPHITLGASANYLRNDQLRGERSWSFGIGPLISWSFPNQVAARAQVRQARAQAAASLAKFDGTVLTALKETEQALAVYDATLKQRAALVMARDQARSAYTLAQKRFRVGAINYLDVLVAQGVLMDAEAALTAAEQKLGSQRVSVFLALGGGWDKNNDNAVQPLQVSLHDSAQSLNVSQGLLKADKSVTAAF